MRDGDGGKEIKLLFASNWIVIYSIFAAGIFFVVKLYKRLRRQKFSKGLKPIPEVSGRYFYIGHGLSFRNDIIGFVRKCYQKYGNIFKIKIFRFSMVVICDREYASEFFKAGEHAMSLYDNLARLGFIDAFFPIPGDIKYFTEIIKNSIGNRFAIFLPKIRDQAILLTQSLKQKVIEGWDGELDLVKELGHFMAGTSAWCIAGVHLNQLELNELHQFNQIVNKVMVSSYFVPRWFISAVYGRRLRQLKLKIGSIIYPKIKQYREDFTKVESPFLRAAIDKRKVDGTLMSDEDIGNLFVCLLYTSSENTALALSNALIDLALRPELYEMLRAEMISLFENEDISKILQNPLLNACLMESIRLSPQIFTIGRTPKSPIVIGEYYLDNDVDSVILCGPLLQVYGSASEVFQNPEVYDPFRFIRKGEKKDPHGPPAINAWGGGVHHCPGKTFALYEIKTLFALFLANFYLDIKNPKEVVVDYFAPKAFSEKKIKCRLKLAKSSN